MLNVVLYLPPAPSTRHHNKYDNKHNQRDRYSDWYHDSSYWYRDGH